MKKIKIVVDSTADLTREEILKYDVEIIPLTVSIDGVEIENISNEDYIFKMRTANNFFTSQPAIGKIMRTYEKLTNEGYDIISIHLSDVISGTVNTAISAASSFSNVSVINSKTTSRGMVYLVKECFELVSNGKNLTEITNLLNNKVNKILTYVTIDRLENLVKGGRLKKTSGLIGGLLNIKILTKLESSELITLEKVRGKKRLVQALLDRIIKDSNQKIKNISLAHAFSEDYVKLIKEAISTKLKYNILDDNVVITSPVISTHTGEGAVGILIELE